MITFQSPRFLQLRAVAAFLVLAVTLLAFPAALRAADPQKPTVRLGYFPNVTHAQALIGVQLGDFERALGKDAKLETVTFTAGPAVIEAVLAGHLDISYIGPSPTLNGFIKTKGEDIRVIAGAVSNGTVLVGNRKKGITSVEKLRGGRVGTPQHGNTQDISARYYFPEHYGIPIGKDEKSVEIIPMAPADMEILIAKDQLEGAWVPEPWGARMRQSGLVEILEEERNLWPEKNFVLTNIIVRKGFLDAHPELVEKFLEAHVRLTRELKDAPEGYALVVRREIQRVTGKALPAEVISESLQRCGFDTAPNAASFQRFFEMGRKLGFLKADRLEITKLIVPGPLEKAIKADAAKRTGSAAISTAGGGSTKAADKPTTATAATASAKPADGSAGSSSTVSGGRRAASLAVFAGFVLALAAVSWRYAGSTGSVVGGVGPGKRRTVTVQVLFAAALLVLWDFFVALELFPRYLFPHPLDVVRSLIEFHHEGKLLPSLGSSLGRMAIGYSISLVGGMAIGVLAARLWLFRQTFGQLILALQSLPSICWLPLSLLWVGFNERAVIAVVVLGAMFSIAIATENAIRNVPPIYGRVGRTLGARGFVLAKDILFFAAFPEIMGGLKVGWTFAWRSLMAAELIRPDAGLGQFLEIGRQFNDVSLMLASMAAILVIGITVDSLIFGKIEKRIRVRWGLEKQ